MPTSKNLPRPMSSFFIVFQSVFSLVDGYDSFRQFFCCIYSIVDTFSGAGRFHAIHFTSSPLFSTFDPSISAKVWLLAGFVRRLCHEDMAFFFQGGNCSGKQAWHAYVYRISSQNRQKNNNDIHTYMTTYYVDNQNPLSMGFH